MRGTDLLLSDLARALRGAVVALLLLAAAPALAGGAVASRHKPGAIVHPGSSRRAGDAPGELLGDTSVESQYDLLPAGRAEAFRVTARSSGPADMAHLYISAHDTARVLIVGLYSSSAGHPAALLSTGSAATARPGSWAGASIAPVEVVAGRSYWLAILGEGGTLRYRDRAGGPCTSVTSASSRLRGLPRAWHTGATYSDCPVSAYLTGSGAPVSQEPGGGPSGSTFVPGLPEALPTVAAAPVLSGIATQGQTLSVSTGAWNGGPTYYAYQWQDCNAAGEDCSPTAGATSSTYTLQPADSGHTVRATVTASNLNGSASSSSPPSQLIGASATANPGNGLSSDASFFPVGVWLQTATATARRFAELGVNTFVGQWQGNTEAALGALKEAGEFAISEQDSIGLSSPDTQVIRAWQSTPDEPDDAQPNGKGGYGPCVEPKALLAEYDQLKAREPSRPVYVNFGQGVAETKYIGRGSCTGDTGMYEEYARAADIVSFDVYPVNEGYPLSIIATGVENLRAWAGAKPLFTFIETTSQTGGAGPTPAQIRAETWLALIHGADGIEYFCDVLEPSFVEDGCLDLPSVREQIDSDDAQIASLAPVLNSATIDDGVTVTAPFRVDTVEKSYGGAIYLFAEADGEAGGSATFTLPVMGAATVSVLGENRTLSTSAGSFSDSFSGYGVHLYEITAG